MSNDINLLKGGKANRLRQEKLLRFLQRGSIISLAAVVVCSMLFFFLNTKSPAISLREEEKAVISKMTAHQKSAVKLLLIEGRTRDILTILEKRSVLDNMVKNISELVPEGVRVDSLQIDRKNFSMIVRSSSLMSLDTLLNRAVLLTENKKIAKVTMEGLSMDKNRGFYILSFSGDFP
ncbi:MAG: hypothetical protein HYV39_00195 [Candidatus Levybacteria bacterium]|nr:hypothetical protein [Candidatus Levybacteria bacterium]